MQMIKCLAQGNKVVATVRLKPATPRSPVKHSTTELQPSSKERVNCHQIHP